MKRLMRISLCFFVLFAIVTMGLVSRSVYLNYKLRNGFEPKENAYPYGEEVEKGTLDLVEISYLLPSVVALIQLPDYKDDIASPIEISYYADIKDKSPVYRVEKGDIIYFQAEDSEGNETVYHGRVSLPTNEPGWRLAKPFMVEGKETIDTLLYVKLDDLIRIAYQWLEENPKAVRAMGIDKSDIGVLGVYGIWPTQSNFSKILLLYIDRILYSEGVFLSPDLLNPVFSSAAFVSLFLSIISLALFLLARHRSKRTREDHTDAKPGRSSDAGKRPYGSV